MRQLEIDSQTNLSHILSEIKTTEENGLELNTVPDQKTVLDSSIHRSIIEKVAKFHKKEVVFPFSSIEDAPEVDSDDLGFVEGEDVVAIAPITEVHKVIQPTAVVSKDIGKKKSILPKFLKNKWVLLGSSLVALFLILGAGFYFLPSAKVDIVLTSDKKDTQVALTGDTKAKEVDVKNKIVPMKAVEVSKDGNDEIVATGKKTVGTYAVGRVTLYNLDTIEEKSFPASTTVLTANSSPNPTFKMKNDIVLPKAPSLGDPSFLDVDVVAIKPGTESNVVANTTFKVNSITSLVYGKNSLALAGGSSKQVTVASTADRETLKKQIVDQLTDTAKKDLEKKTKDSLVPEDAQEVEIVKETYEPSSVDAESEKLKATITVKVKTVVVNKEDLVQVLVDSLEKSAEGYTVDVEASKITLQQTESVSDTSAKLIGKIKAVLHPEIDKKEIARQTSGKSLSEVQSYLDSTEKISSYKVVTLPGFFKVFNRMPFSVTRIEVNLADQ